MKKILPKFFISVNLVLGNLIMLVKFDSLETKKAFAVGENCGDFINSTDDNTGWGREGVYLYENDNFMGRCTKLNFSDGNAWNWFVGNDYVSSIKIVGSWEVKVYEYENYGGGAVEWNTGNTNNYLTKLDIMN